MGKVIMSGIVPQLVVPTGGILASELAVGSVVYLMENESPAEYRVVHHGLPNATLYDASCDGTWLLRNDGTEKVVWSTANSNDYAASDVHSFLNNIFYNRFSEKTKTAIKTVRIPYRVGSGCSDKTVVSGANGLQTNVFLLSAIETGFSSNYFPVDGARLDYFNTTEVTKVLTASSSSHRTRTPFCVLDGTGINYVCIIGRSGDNGSVAAYTPITELPMRPALILPSTAVFDEETLILKGVA